MYSTYEELKEAIIAEYSYIGAPQEIMLFFAEKLESLDRRLSGGCGCNHEANEPNMAALREQAKARGINSFGKSRAELTELLAFQIAPDNKKA